MVLQVPGQLERRELPVAHDHAAVHHRVAHARHMAEEQRSQRVVVRAGQTSRHALRHALRSLAAVESPILGMVLNYQTHKKGGGYGYSYGYGYGYGYRSKETEAAS